MIVVKIPFDRVSGKQAETIYIIDETDLDSNGEVRNQLDNILEDSDTPVTLTTHQSLSSLKNFPKIVKGNVDLSDSGLTSLAGIGKNCLEECEWLFLPPNIKSHILGLILIKGLKCVYFEHSRNGFQADEKFTTAMGIASKFINLDDDDVMSFQEDLFKEKLNEYGKL